MQWDRKQNTVPCPHALQLRTASSPPAALCTEEPALIRGLQWLTPHTLLVSVELLGDDENVCALQIYAFPDGPGRGAVRVLETPFPLELAVRREVVGDTWTRG